MGKTRRVKRGLKRTERQELGLVSFVSALLVRQVAGDEHEGRPQSVEGRDGAPPATDDKARDLKCRLQIYLWRA